MTKIHFTDGVDNSESNNEPLWRPSKTAMGKRPSKDSYTSTLGKRVAVTPLTLMSAQSLHPEGQKVNAFFGEEDELESAPVVSTKVSDLASE